jgi:hypothetical protein
MNDDIAIRQVFRTVKCVLIKDKTTGRKRFNVLPNQGIPTDLFIEADRAIRDFYPVGTIFIASKITVLKKVSGRLYLRAEHQSLTPIEKLKLNVLKS